MLKYKVSFFRRIKFLEEDRRPFNPANAVQIDPNETLRIPNEFQYPHHQKPLRNHYSSNVPYSPFINNHRGGVPQSYFVPPPDSPLIHAPGRLSLKSPSISNTNNNNHNNMILNSPFPLQISSNRSKVPRRVIKK